MRDDLAVMVDMLLTAPNRKVLVDLKMQSWRREFKSQF